MYRLRTLYWVLYWMTRETINAWVKAWSKTDLKKCIRAYYGGVVDLQGEVKVRIVEIS